MIYLTEDYKGSRLSSLMMESYNDTSHIKPSGGNGKFVDGISNLRSSGYAGDIGIILDLVPDNINTVVIYKKLADKYRSDKSIFVLPIVCSEYYLIQSVVNQGLVDIDDNIRICIDRQPHIKAPIYSEFIKLSDKYSNTFEGYCKYIMDNLLKCISEENPEYFNKDCKCENKDRMTDKCFNIDKKDKSLKYLYEFPAIPCGITETSEYKLEHLDRNKFIDLHNRLIDEYNEHVKLYQKNGYTKKKSIGVRSMFTY